MGRELWGCLNEAIQFNRKLLGQGRFWLEPLAEGSHFKLIRQEIGKVIKGDPNADILGVLSNVLALSFVFVGIAWTPFGVYLNFDPGYFFFEYVFYPMSSQTKATKTISFIVRLFLTYWSVLEATRSYAFILILDSSFFDVILRGLRSIRKIPVSECSISAYSQLRCTIQIGHNQFRYLTGILMSAAFVNTVVGNWLCLLGWKFIPIEVNLSICLISVSVYISTSTYLPALIKFNSSCKLLINTLTIRFIKRRCVLVNNALQSTGLSLKLWRKLCKAQQPITMYWCTSKFQKDTEVLFYSRIIEYTISFMLGYKAAK